MTFNFEPYPWNIQLYSDASRLVCYLVVLDGVVVYDLYILVRQLNLESFLFVCIGGCIGELAVLLDGYLYACKHNLLRSSRCKPMLAATFSNSSGSQGL